MTEFFYNDQAGETHTNKNVLKHHFTFETFYEPTKFGRSTLRRADYITINKDYSYIAQRNFILLLYPLGDITLQLNTTSYNLPINQISAFIIPFETVITLSSHIINNLCLFECDITDKPNTVTHFDISDTHYLTHINVINIENMLSLNLEKMPFFALVLAGNITIDETKLRFYDGFYTQKIIELTGSGKILTFSMPIPL